MRITEKNILKIMTMTELSPRQQYIVLARTGMLGYTPTLNELALSFRTTKQNIYALERLALTKIKNTFKSDKTLSELKKEIINCKYEGEL